MLIDRLVFGTARLTGGVDQRRAVAALEAALTGGIRHIDTAPTYGLGTAEQVVGMVLVDRPDVSITAKAGLPHPRHAYARTIARSVKRRFSRQQADRVPPPAEPPSGAGGSGRGHFTPAFMSRSFERSLRNLRRDSAELLLLHEAYADDARPDVLAWLDMQRRAGWAGALGFSNGRVFGPAADTCFPREFVSQCAVDPQWFLEGPAEPAIIRDRIVHSVTLTITAMMQSQPQLKTRLETAARSFCAGRAPNPIELVAAAFAILHDRLPNARFVFASTDVGRIAGFLAAVGEIDAIGCSLVERRFGLLPVAGR